MSSQWTGSIEWLEGLKNAIQYRGGFLSMYGFQQPVTGYLIGLLMLATWLNEQAVTAYQLIKSESKEFTSEVVYKLAAVSLKVCLRVLTMVCSLEAQYSHTSYLIRKIHTSLRQTRTKCFIFPILEMGSVKYQSPLEDQWSISDFDSD